jgi:transporter family protein
MSQDQIGTGVIYALIAGILWGVGPLLLKKGMTLSNVSTATLTMQIVSVLTLSAATGIRGEFHFAELSFAAFWPFVAAGAVGASFGKIFYYYGIDTVGASKSVSIKNSSPILTTILAVVILGERVTLPLAAGVVLIVAGIILLTRVQGRAEGSPNQIAYFIYPLLAALCFGINPIVKKIGVSTVSVPTFGALITQTTALIVMLTAGRLLNIKLKWEKVPMRSLGFFVLAGVMEALGSLLTFYALIYAPAVLVSPIWRISPLVTFVLAHFTLKGIEVVTLRDGVAASIIVGGILLLGQS